METKNLKSRKLSLVLLATATLLFPAAAAVDPCPNNTNEVQVGTLIVGAGGTGLFAGYYLSKLGYENFKILEATNEIGGRLREVCYTIDTF